MRTAAINPACQRCGLWQRPCACSNFGEVRIGALTLTPELTLDGIDAHLDYPAECAACSAHTCACLAANDSNWASYTSCTDEDGGWVEGVGP